MNESILKDLLCKKIGEAVRITHLDRKEGRLPLLNNETISWRDHLLSTFRHRLNSIQKKSGDQTLFNETQQFLYNLEEQPKDAILYIWKAYSSSNKYVGWASDKEIIYSRKYE